VIGSDSRKPDRRIAARGGTQRNGILLAGLDVCKHTPAYVTDLCECLIPSGERNRPKTCVIWGGGQRRAPILTAMVAGIAPGDHRTEPKDAAAAGLSGTVPPMPRSASRGSAAGASTPTCRRPASHWSPKYHLRMLTLHLLETWNRIGTHTRRTNNSTERMIGLLFEDAERDHARVRPARQRPSLHVPDGAPAGGRNSTPTEDRVLTRWG
jgi:hypothetical protein